jgi:hypothetical protein
VKKSFWNIIEKAVVLMLSSVLVLGGIIVAPSQTGAAAAESVTGYLWKELSGTPFSKIAYDGQGLYVAVNSSVGKIYTSTDLVNWSTLDISAVSTRPISALEYIDGSFYAVTLGFGAGATILRSTNGTDWTGVDSAEPSYSRSSIAYGNHTFVVPTNNTPMYYFQSGDGETWSRQQYDAVGTSSVFGVNYANGQFMAVGSSGSMMTSTNGINWSPVVKAAGEPALQAIASDGQGKYVAVGSGGEILRTDPNSGSDFPLLEVSSPATSTLYDVAYSAAGGGYVAVGDYATLFSADGITWTPEAENLVLQKVIYADGKWVAVGNSGVYQRTEVNLAIDTQPEDISVVPNDSAVLIIGATAGGGESVSYQWYSNTADSNSGGTPIVNAQNYYYHAPTASTGTVYYYCFVKIPGSTAAITSDAAAVTVSPLTHAATPDITFNPQDKTVYVGENAPLTVQATAGDAGILSYQWYTNTSNSNSGGQPIANATGSTFAAPTETAGIIYYYVKVTNTNNSATGTKTATATSSAAAVQVDIAPTYTISTLSDRTAAPLIQGYTPGVQETVTVTFSNTGTADLTNLSAVLGGTHGGDFEITQPAGTLTSGAAATSFTVKAKDDLPAGTYTATITLKANNMADVSFMVTQAVYLPDAPANPEQLAPVEGNREVTLQWNTVTEATYYQLYMSQLTGQFDGPSLATVTDTTYTIAGLTNGQVYYFVVKAGNDGGLSAASNQVQATPATVPDAPVHIAASAGDGQVTVSFAAPADNGGSPITGYDVTDSTGTLTATGVSSPVTIEGLVNGTAYTFTVKAINSKGKSAASSESNNVIPVKPVEPEEPGSGYEDTGESTGPAVTPNTPAANVVVKGTAGSVGTAKTATINNRTVTTFTLDQRKLEEKLAADGQNVVLSVQVDGQTDVVVGEMNGQTLRSMAVKQAVFEIKTPYASYTLPAQHIDLEAISEQLGESVTLQDIQLQVEVSPSSADMMKLVQSAAEKGGFTVVAPPVDFTVRAAYKDKTISVSKFNAFVERTITLPDHVDLSGTLTGLVIEPDGTFRHVPTKIIKENGKAYARINSLTNSTYVVVKHPVSYTDVESHWAKEAVEDLGFRMAYEDPGMDTFGPDQEITRAEFAALMVRGIGIRPETEAAPFSDVKASDRYSSAINSAYAYRLISGFEDGTFRPKDKITREEAMVVVAKMMVITNLKEKLPVQDTDTILQPYSDADEISVWARSGIADSIQAGIVSGRSGTEIAPKAYVTRAEMASIVRRLLQKSELI